VPLALPRNETDADARQASANVIAALGEGEITPKEAEHLLRTVAAAGVIIQSSEIIARLIRLEEGLARLIAAQTPLQITAAS
jgi:hypothetical protein